MIDCGARSAESPMAFHKHDPGERWRRVSGAASGLLRARPKQRRTLGCRLVVVADLGGVGRLRNSHIGLYGVHLAGPRVSPLRSGRRSLVTVHDLKEGCFGSFRLGCKSVTRVE
ncbi:MAG: hypothetical protein ACI88C_001704 [Acidimicrobiales bacterium]